MPNIIVRRDKIAFADGMRAYTVVIDGEERGTLRQNDVLIWPVDRGSHSVRMSIDWCGSKTMSVEVDDRDVVLTCAPSSKLPWLASLLIVTPDRWIELHLAE